MQAEYARKGVVTMDDYGLTGVDPGTMSRPRKAESSEAEAQVPAACPFCGWPGWEVVQDPLVFEGAAGWRVECAGPCHAMTCWWLTRADAVAAWNRRPVPDNDGQRDAAEDWIDYVDTADGTYVAHWEADAVLRRVDELEDDNAALRVKAETLQTALDRLAADMNRASAEAAQPSRARAEDDSAVLRAIVEAAADEVCRGLPLLRGELLCFCAPCRAGRYLGGVR